MTADAILLLAHGSPESATDVPEFMRRITGGRPIPPEVMAEVQHRYEAIGRSPLTEITLRQAAALQEHTGSPVYVGMRNWRPFIADAVRRMHADGVGRAAVICLAPQNSRTSVGLYRAALEQAAPQFASEFVESWHDHPLLIEAFTEKLLAELTRVRAEGASEPAVIFTAHSVPCRTILAGDPYGVQGRQTAALVAKRAGISRWYFAFQSQGMSGGTWIGPTVEDTLAALSAEGERGVLVQPVGFVCDHVEVLYDIDVMFAQKARELGMRLWRAESLNEAPSFIAALAQLAGARLTVAVQGQSTS